MINNILVYNEKYFYKGVFYTNSDLNLLLKKISKRRRIILCTENILVKKYHYNEKNIEKFIENKIIEDFDNRENLLFHYEIDKENNSIYLYSIRDNKMKKLYDNSKTLIIEPIQFKIKNYVFKKIKKTNNLIIYFKIDGLNQLIKISNKIIVESIINEDINKIIEYINRNKDMDYILVKDKKIKDVGNLEFHYSIDMGADLYEKIC